MKKMLLALILIVFISGCALPESIQQLMPGYENQEVKELPPDIVVVEDLSIIPNPPINADDQFTVTLVIKNQDDVNEVQDVGYEVFDTGLCKMDSKDVGFKTLSPPKLAPLQEEFLEWTLDAPTNDEIVHLSTKCPFRFKVNYNFDSVSQIDVDVINDVVLRELQRTGKTATFTPTLTVGRGPIKIYLSFGSSLPVKSGNKLPLYLTVEDKGNGLYANIPEGTLLLKIPENFAVADCDKFVAGEVTTSTIPVTDEMLCYDFCRALGYSESGCSSTPDFCNTFPQCHLDNTVCWYDCIDKGKGRCTAPEDYCFCWKEMNCPDCSEGETCTNEGCVSTLEGYKIYRNIEPIPLIRKKSPQLRCSLTAPSESYEKTYYITASLNYDYTVTAEREVAIQPTATS